MLEGVSYSEWPYRLLPENVGDLSIKESSQFYQNKGFQPRGFSFISIDSLTLLNATLLENCQDYRNQNLSKFPEFSSVLLFPHYFFQYNFTERTYFRLKLRKRRLWDQNIVGKHAVPPPRNKFVKNIICCEKRLAFLAELFCRNSIINIRNCFSDPNSQMSFRTQLFSDHEFEH